MAKMIEIRCKNNSTVTHYPIGTNLKTICQDQNIQLSYPVIGARVNNEIEELNYEIFKPKIVEFFDLTNPDGMRMYFRGLSFILIKAARDLYPEGNVRIEHSVAKGFYCEFEHSKIALNDHVVEEIKERMQQIIEEDLPFIKRDLLVEHAIKLFETNELHQKANLFKQCPVFFTSVYYLQDQIDYFYGYLIPSTGYINKFELEPFYDGMLLRLPNRYNPEQIEEKIRQDKMFEIFQEYKNWGKVLGVESVGAINDEVINERSGELIKIGEALHEKKVVEITEMMLKRRPLPRIVLISGPSASGKTTFSKRLSVQLRVAGYMPHAISLDNYFVNREETPLDENGQYNFETIEALDTKLLNDHLNQLLNGGTIQEPRFSFDKGERFYPGEELTLATNSILIIEGIHALNPRLIENIKDELTFKIYISALTQVGIDSHNRIPTTDNRLIRRLIRDYRYRGYSALETLRRWPSVRKGEESNIFPYQENCDIMFNSALVFELGVLKKYATPLLEEVKPLEREYSEAQRLLKFLSYFKPIHTKEIPPTSILREFLYGSTFSYS